MISMFPLIISIFVFLLLLGDRLSKMLFWLSFEKNYNLSDFFNIKLSFFPNYFLSFGLYLPQFLIVGVSYFLIACIFSWIFCNWRRFNNHELFCWLLIEIGALSNLWDRLRYGYVIDWIQIQLLNFAIPVFNIADILIAVGICGLLVMYWRQTENK